jgi:hypothetical protein
VTKTHNPRLCYTVSADASKVSLEVVNTSLVNSGIQKFCSQKCDKQTYMELRSAQTHNNNLLRLTPSAYKCHSQWRTHVQPAPCLLFKRVCVCATHLSLQRQIYRAQNVCFVRAEKFAQTHSRRWQKFCSGCFSSREEAHDINSNYTQVRACKTMRRMCMRE